MKHSKAYLYIIAIVFVALVVVFNFLPRSTFSKVENRSLATFPEVSAAKLTDGSLTAGISSWYSDTEPFREDFMTMHMQLKQMIGIKSPFSDDGETITFHASDYEGVSVEDAPTTIDGVAEASDTTHNADENAKMGSKGILVVGEAPTARALMLFGGGTGAAYAAVVNEYKSTFPNVNVYCMIIPNSSEYYLPEKAKNLSRSQRDAISSLYSHLSGGAKGVNIWQTLYDHKDEDIFLRTDHHWAPKGAYYAAQEFARVAGVPFRDLSSYTQHVVHGFVGTMYGYSKDIAVKQSPEDFVYWTPNGIDYTTTYINYTTDKDLHITGKSAPFKGKFFFQFKDGSGGAYCTFMGGDSKITQVRTGTHNGRRLIILKDSFGNALPGYLFYSFEEIHVIDCRYFLANMKDYVRENKITDILFANNTFMMNANRPISNYRKFLTQNGKVERREEVISSEKENETAPDDIQKEDTAPDATRPEPEKTQKPENPETPDIPETPDYTDNPDKTESSI